MIWDEWLADSKLSPYQRQKIGREMWALGDRRPGVGLRKDGLPDIVWCHVLAGNFIYGSENWHSGNGPIEMELPDFSIAMYPVTNAQFDAFVKAPDGFSNDIWWHDLAIREKALKESEFSHSNCPRETVSWYDAIAFCRWLSTKLGQNIRLPTEYEWEKAARGTDGLLYPYGNEFDFTKCNTEESGLQNTSPVGIFPAGASPYGLQDMCGNVCEWCINEYDSPRNISTTGTVNRPVRGGSWLDPQQDVITSFRWSMDGNDAQNFVGFRLLTV